MSFWLQECPHCHYVNGDISESLLGAEWVVGTPEFLSIGNDVKTPALARTFERFAMLVSTDPVRAGQALLHAAWVCDDLDKKRRAQAYRCESAEFLSSAFLDIVTEQDRRWQVVLVDIWRRAKCFEEAYSLIERLRTLPGLTDTMSKVIDFQELRIRDQDIAAYTVEQALKYHQRFWMTAKDRPGRYN